MELFHIEIEKFIKGSKYSTPTKIRYLKHLVAFGNFLADKTGNDYENFHLQKVKSIKDVKGNTFYIPIKSTLIDEYLFSLTEMKFHYISMARSSLGSFFKYLRKNYDFPYLIDLIEFNISDYRPESKHRKILHRHEIIKFFQSIINHSTSLSRDVLLFVLLVSTGCRINEILSLKVSDINFSEDCFILRKTKNRKQHVVVLRKGIGEILRRYCDQNYLSDKDYLFKGQANQPLTRAFVNQLLSFYLKKSKLTKVNLHSLRHSFATLMYESGSAITTIMQLLNHSNLSSTKTYVNPNYVRNYNLKIPQNDEVFKHFATLDNKY